MKILVTALIAASVLASGVEAGSMKWIKKEADFRAMAVDKKITSSFGWVMINSNGKLTGKLTNGRFKGGWNWQKGYYCRNAKVGKKELGFDCQVIKSDGSAIDFIREQGTGKVSSWTIE
ncbi:MAG: hypothetical protein KUG74_02635 [Rhodobacteraceae bacterium]|nr:hypothetical protein [Paracoccaceae bacterium]